MVLVEETPNRLPENFTKHITVLFQHILKSTNDFVIANYFIEVFEEAASHEYLKHLNSIHPLIQFSMDKVVYEKYHS